MRKRKICDPRIDFFHRLAGGWDEEQPSAEEMTARLENHRELLNLRRGQDLLEVGCGTGKTTPWLVAQVAPGRVTGVDFAPGMIHRARAKGIHADFACLDVCEDELDAGAFDVILCFHCFPHFRDQSAALRNLAQALKPAGRLIVMHLAGSEHINHFHAGLVGPVAGDVLPVGPRWLPLLEAAGLRQTSLADREDLFFLEAVSDTSQA